MHQAVSSGGLAPRAARNSMPVVGAPSLQGARPCHICKPVALLTDLWQADGLCPLFAIVALWLDTHLASASLHLFADRTGQPTSVLTRPFTILLSSRKL
jgi:hypothetical protein